MKLNLLTVLAWGTCGLSYGAQAMQGTQNDAVAMSIVAANDVEQLRVLIQAGMNINAPGPDGLAPLHVAAKHGHCPCIRLLLEHGAQLNANSRAGKTPLQYAVEEGTPESIMLFLDQKAVIPGPQGVIDIIIFKRFTEAWQNSDSDLMKQWINTDVPAHCILTQAIFQEHYAIIASLLNLGIKMNHQHIPSVTPLAFAAVRGNSRILTMLLAAGADPNEKSGGVKLPSAGQELPHSYAFTGPLSTTLYSPLLLASYKGNVECVDALIKAGAYVNPDDPRSPLWAACLEEHPEVVSLLINSGADLDETAFMVAWEKSFIGTATQEARLCVNHLLKTSAHIDTAMRLAVYYKKHKVLKILLEKHKGDPHTSIVARGGVVSLANFTLLNQDPESFALLRTHGALLDSHSLAYALESQLDDIVQAMLKQGALVHSRDYVLHLAAARGSVPLLTSFLAHGASLNRQALIDQNNHPMPPTTGRNSTTTELGYALQSSSSECVRLLLDAGSDPRSVMRVSEKKVVDALTFALQRNPLEASVPQRTSLVNLKELIKQSYRLFRPCLDKALTARKTIWPIMRLLRQNDIPLLVVLEILLKDETKQDLLIDIFLSDLNNEQSTADNRLRFALRAHGKGMPFNQLYGHYVASTKLVQYDHEQFTLLTASKPFVVEHLFEKVLTCVQPLLPQAFEDVQALFTTEEGQQEIRSLIAEGVTDIFEKLIFENRNHTTEEKRQNLEQQTKKARIE